MLSTIVIFQPRLLSSRLSRSSDNNLFYITSYFNQVPNTKNTRKSKVELKL